MNVVCLVTQRKVLQEDQEYKVHEVKKEETDYLEGKVCQDLKETKEVLEDNVQSVVMELKETRVTMVKTDEMAFQGNLGFKEELVYRVLWETMDVQVHQVLLSLRGTGVFCARGSSLPGQHLEHIWFSLSSGKKLLRHVDLTR